jgi:hypothetical protein
VSLELQLAELVAAALVGLVLGWWLGARSAGREMARQNAALASLSNGEPLAELANQSAELQAVAAGLLRAGQTSDELLALRRAWQKLRHDVRGALSPALLTADRLTGHADESVRRGAEIMVKAVERAVETLKDP